MAKYFLIAGEASGDMHAAALIEQIRLLDPEATFSGLGGDRMEAAKCRLYQSSRRMSFMGFAAVLRNIGQVRRNFRIARRALLETTPDVLILIDYPSFNLKMAAFCRRKLPATRIIYYIPPKVWAWKPWRIHRIARLCDRILAIFPFEPDYYKRHGYDCTYVGNPTVEELSQCSNPIAQQSRNVSVPQSGERPLIALLPGSRPSEVTHCLPRMLTAARRFPQYRIVVSAAPGLEEAFYRPYLREGETLTRDTHAVVREAQAAVVNSGTATLETALLGCPQVAVYHLACSRLIGMLRWAQSLVFSIRHFTLVNILAGEEVIPELVADDFTADKVAEALQKLLTDEQYTQKMLAEYEHLRLLLGTQSAAANAARECVS